MLYLKELSVDRFKSFKHVNVLFNKGFNCVVGPNGSGKSNIIDALLFSLGESSLHRLRVRRLDELIHAAPGKRPTNLSKAHVKIDFDGDEKIEVTRGVRADGKTVYRLNGKRMTKQEVLEVLKKHRVHIDETSTITQGEINRLIDLNPKQRRELIDLAAGIKEFEYKKQEALQELEKVSAKVSESQAILNERIGFLKSLEKEKEQAESYLAKSKKLKTLNYSILATKKKAIEVALVSYDKELGTLEEKKKGYESKLAETAKKASSLEEERQKLTKVLTEFTTALGDISNRQNQINSELSALEVRITSNKGFLEEAKTATDAAKEELKSKAEKIKSNAAEIASLKSRISGLAATEKKLGAFDESDETEAAKTMNELGKEIETLEQKVKKNAAELSELKANEASLMLQKESNADKMSGIEQELAADKKSLAGSKEEGASLKERNARLASEQVELQKQLTETRERLGKVDGEIIEIKEQRAAVRSREGMLLDRLRSNFSARDGFYGTAAELCTYPGQYSEAIEAAAGSRFNYLVVDSIDVANSMIQYLRKSNLGRATFIPLQELNVGEERNEKGLKAVTDLLKFESKFGDVFAYIFSDTYLIDSVDDAKRLGVGRHRYVTVSGETVEKSGVLSGGSRAKGVSIATLEKRLKELEKEQRELNALVLSLGDKQFESRKESAAAEMRFATLNSTATSYESGIAKKQAALASLEKEAKGVLKQLEETMDGVSSLEKENADGESALAEKRARLKGVYEKTRKEIAHVAKLGVKTEHLEELEKLRKEVKELEIKSAEKQQENKMLGENTETLDKTVKEKGAFIEKTQREINTDLKRRAELEESKAKIDQEIKSSGKSNEKRYKRVEEIGAEMQKLAQEQGTAGASAENLARQMEETRLRKGQQEVRLNDITAELAAYGNAEQEVINQDVETMEKDASLLGSQIAELGNVNLKAPEVYEEKVKSVSEATEKVNTLEAEKHAVLSMIEEIDSKKLNSFITTYSEVNKNFSKLYNYIFPGRAYIELEDQDNPLAGGLDVKIEDGKSFKRINLLSGGQKSLISLMLIFSIHMCKPSSLYLFDEIDSALDKENSKKLSQLIKEMAKDAQFIVVSHNDSLIVNADAALGVMRSQEESKVVGIEISSIRNK